MSEEVKAAVQRVVEFDTAGEEYWRVDRFDLLARDFEGIEPAGMSDWHDILKGQGLAWSICERLYQVGSMLDAPEEVMREWKKDEIAKRFGIPVAQVDAEIHRAAEHWRLETARRDLDRDAKTTADESEIDQLTNFSSAGDMGEDTIERLLTAFNFKEVKDPMHRVQVAKRILSLKDYLASPHTRTTAREIIRFEITMHGLEKVLTTTQNKVDRLIEEDAEMRVNDSEISRLTEKCKELDTEIRKIGAEHAKRQVAIGADDIDMTTRKRIFVETVAYIQEKCREYESDPENVLVDGVFRAREIDWLMDPLGEREPQYRPDIVVRLDDALCRKNLWDPEYVPPPISIRVCQELRKMVENMRKVPEDAPPLMELDDEDEDAAAVGEEGMDLSLGADTSAAGEVEMMGAAPFGRRGEDEDGGETIGIY
jgi:hypothetical protein